MVYIVENNGVYGLTKGQFSATADRGSKSKRGVINTDNSHRSRRHGAAARRDASWRARFSGDKNQLVPLIKAAIEHKGAAFIDVISPCVAFNNHAGSTKSFDYVREHNEAVNRLDFIAEPRRSRSIYEPGTVEVVEQHDGSSCALRKLAADYDAARPHRRDGLPAAPRRQGADRHRPALCRRRAARTCTPTCTRWTAPLNTLGEKELCPGPGGARQDQRLCGSLTSQPG